MYRLILAIASLSVGLMVNMPINARRLPQRSNTSAEKVSVFQILEDLGKRHDRFFTIEGTSIETENIFYQTVEKPISDKNVFGELDRLKRLVPNLTYHVDKRNPRLIHLSDIRLTQQKQYALDRTINRINLTGTLYDLVNAVRKQGIPVSPTGMAMGTDEWLATDFGSKVHIRGKRLRVRQVFSDFIPLEGRSSRILWIAETKPDQTTYVRFRGAAPLAKTGV